MVSVRRRVVGVRPSSFRGGGYKVICSHLNNGEDFFTFEPKDYDLIISNPPFSKKDAVIKRLYELGKPFAILLPIQSLQSKERKGKPVQNRLSFPCVRGAVTHIVSPLSGGAII